MNVNLVKWDIMSSLTKTQNVKNVLMDVDNVMLQDVSKLLMVSLLIKQDYIDVQHIVKYVHHNHNAHNSLIKMVVLLFLLIMIKRSLLNVNLDVLHVNLKIYKHVINVKMVFHLIMVNVNYVILFVKHVTQLFTQNVYHALLILS